MADDDESVRFYQRALDVRRRPELDHFRDDGSRYAVMLDVPGLGTLLELRLNPERATRQAGFDPLTVAVDDRAALDSWAAVVTERTIKHSPVLTGVQAWLIVVEDPDGNRFRLYTLERHGPDVAPSTDSTWLNG